MRAVYRGNLKDQRRIQEHRGLCEYNIEQNLRLQEKLREMAGGEDWEQGQGE